MSFFCALNWLTVRFPSLRCFPRRRWCSFARLSLLPEFHSSFFYVPRSCAFRESRVIRMVRFNGPLHPLRRFSTPRSTSIPLPFSLFFLLLWYSPSPGAHFISYVAGMDSEVVPLMAKIFCIYFFQFFLQICFEWGLRTSKYVRNAIQ